MIVSLFVCIIYLSLILVIKINIVICNDSSKLVGNNYYLYLAICIIYACINKYIEFT